MRGGNGITDGYNPFDLYGAAERARGEPLPPHLVFAELDKEDPDDACAFLNAYGPLEGTSDYLPLSDDGLREWKNASQNSPAPEEYFRSRLGSVPLLPDPPAPQDHYYSYSLKQFWANQSDFELALRLHTAIDSRSDQFQRIRRTLAVKGVRWDIKGRNIERLYTERAREFVISTLNGHLQLMRPRVARVPAYLTNFAANMSTTVTGVWGCYSLLESMYLMLFLDIVGGSGRIAQCEKCHTLFYTALDKGKYCSPVCENRDRALRAYHKKKGRAVNRPKAQSEQTNGAAARGKG